MPKKRDGPVPRLRTAPGPRGTENDPSCLLRKSYARSTSTDRHIVSGPAAIAVGHFMVAVDVVPDDSVLDVLAEIHERWPDLTFKDFFGAGILAQALALQPRGSA